MEKSLDCSSGYGSELKSIDISFDKRALLIALMSGILIALGINWEKKVCGWANEPNIYILRVSQNL
jgi:hypothetical protein